MSCGSAEVQLATDHVSNHSQQGYRTIEEAFSAYITGVNEDRVYVVDNLGNRLHSPAPIAAGTSAQLAAFADLFFMVSVGRDVGVFDGP
jgi:hypothetical protein